MRQRSGFAWPFRLAWALFEADRTNRAAIAAVRAAMAICSKACADGACMAETYKTAATTRDLYVLLQAGCERLPLPWFVRRRINEAVDDWDDLAEDCALNADPDIRSALNAIASRL
jgi:hypothetical protein